MDSADGHHQMRRRDAVPAGDGHAPAPTTTGGDGRPVAAVVVPVCSLAARAAPAEVDRALRAVADGEVLLGPDVAVRASSYLTGARPTGPNRSPS